MKDIEITLRFDNKIRYDGIKELTIYKSDIPILENFIKKFTGWRTPTKKYRSIWHRFNGSGSSVYDSILDYLITQKLNLWTL